MAPEQDPTYHGEISPTQFGPTDFERGPQGVLWYIKVEKVLCLNGTDENQLFWSTGIEFER